MISKYLDMPLGAGKVKRAEATLLGRRSGDLRNLDKSELMECAWSLSIILVAAQEGFRLAPEVLALAESVAHSPSPALTQSPVAPSDLCPTDDCVHEMAAA